MSIPTHQCIPAHTLTNAPLPMNLYSGDSSTAPQYVELHCHSAFSLLDGASSPEQLIDTARALGLSGLALTDHDDMGGSVRFAVAAREANFPAIIGCELTVLEEHHLVLLARDLTGYKNICRLITLARMKNPRGLPSITMADLESHSKGTVALTGCPKGIVPSLLACGRHEQARANAQDLLDIYKDNFFIELSCHNTAQESLLCRELISLAGVLNIPYAVTNNVHYALQSQHIIHDVLTCLRHNTPLSRAGRRLRPNNQWHLKSAQEMLQLFSNYPLGIKNTLAIAERCQFRLGQLKPELPRIDIAQRLSALLGEPVETTKQLTDFQCLTLLTWLGAKERYGPELEDKQHRQIEHELALIERLELSPYFLIMWDIVNFAGSRGIFVQGRGSAANSAVCYCLKITAVDPVGFDLLFERFISEERNEPPDIDLDIAHKEREVVLQYVYEKYGREHAAMVCEHITYRGPSAVRDAARMLDFSADQADALAAQAHFHEAADAAIMLSTGGAARAGLDIKDRRVQLLVEVVAGLHQLPRHRSIHVGGFVLSGEPIGRIAPVEPASMEGRTVIQWDKDDLGDVGLVKIDLLGLGMLTMISQAVNLIEKHRRFKLDIAKLPADDPAVYEMLRRADTAGVFQVESRAQMSILPKLRPERFYDIVVSIAIVRPGPIQGGIVHPYLRRRRGLETVTYLHPSLEPILSRTLGVPLFQEQGMRLAVTAAGFTPSQADKLRRVMSHKRSTEKMALLCSELACGMAKNGFSKEAIETITFQLKAFANYGFPESHAASFALLVYASAYLKCHFAPEFYCAILNSQPMGFYSPATLIRDAMCRGIEIRPPDLSRSFWDCTLEGTESNLALRIGLRYVNGLGSKAKAALQAAWLEGGCFTSVKDVVARSGLSQSDLSRLAAGGAFESLVPGRRQAMWEVLKLSRNRRAMPLFEALDEEYGTKDSLPVELPPMSNLDKTVADYSILGLTCGSHPMAYYRRWAKERGFVSCAELSQKTHGQKITVAGSVICRQRPHTAKGFVFMTVEDETGTANVIIRPQVFDEFKELILNFNFLAIKGKLQLEDGVVNVIAGSIKVLPPLEPEKEIPVVSRDFH